MITILKSDTGKILRTALNKPLRKVTVEFFDIHYGLLYNKFAVDDSRHLCASGWHIPTVAEFDTLTAYLSTNVGGKLKQTGFTYWTTPNTDATNETNFNGRGSGIRSYSSSFSNLNVALYLHSSDTYLNYHYYGLTLNFNSGSSGKLPVDNNYQWNRFGMSVRPVKDSTSLSNGQTGTYTGNDGKVYRTICIGTQEFVADNLAETKYRNGDTITEVTGSTWDSISYGAMCAYSNNWLYV